MNNTNNFVIRVYAIIINQQDEVLLSDEYHFAMNMTKFPGGGLDFGEGTIDALKREIREECKGQEIENIEHFYTTDFFQKALFFENKQLISIYYTCNFQNPIKFNTSNIPLDFTQESNSVQCLRWCKIKNLTEDEIEFPIDKFVLRKLKLLYK